MKVVAIIQARMGSTRLPGKVLKKVLNKTLLEYQIERVSRAKKIDQIVIATTTKEPDDPIVHLCQQLSLPYYRGSEDDVLSRYFETATIYKADVIVRLTSDCPVIDSDVIDKVVGTFLGNYPNYDYVSNTMERTYPRGMDTEVFSFKSLKKVIHGALNDFEKEHVTPHFYQNPQRYTLKNISNYVNLSRYRLTVDTSEDLELISLIIENLYPNKNDFVLADIINIIESNSKWFYINSHIEQKK